MYQQVRKNFAEKVAYIARVTDGMTVNEQDSFLSIDCALPSDTFNVVVPQAFATPEQILTEVDRFTAKGFPTAVWYWGNDTDTMAGLAGHGLSHNETDTAMYADLSTIRVAPTHVEGLAIRRAETTNDLLQFGETMAALFGDTDEGQQVRTYFQRLCQRPGGDSLSSFPAMCHYLGALDGSIVALGTLFIGSETAGIYDMVTHAKYRRKGIGSAMFQHILEEARNCQRRLCVLQASQDGLGIYLKAGFSAVGKVYVFENRALLSAI